MQNEGLLQIFIWSKFRQIDTAAARSVVTGRSRSTFSWTLSSANGAATDGNFFCYCYEVVSTLISKPSWWWINFPMVGNKRVGKCPHFSFKLVIYLMKGLPLRIISILRSIPMALTSHLSEIPSHNIKSDTKYTFLHCAE